MRSALIIIEHSVSDGSQGTIYGILNMVNKIYSNWVRDNWQTYHLKLHQSQMQTRKKKERKTQKKKINTSFL